MKNIPVEFRKKIYDDEANYIVHANIELADGTLLEDISNTKIWTGGFSYEEAVSQDDSFTALGGVVIGSATIILNNINDEFSIYDYTNATVTLSLSLELNSNHTETLQIGVYTVDDADYNGATIRLSLLDNMAQFDKPYSSSSIDYTSNPRLIEIVQDACTKCGVNLAASSSVFPHHNYTLSSVNAPDADSTTFREVLSYVATVAGCFVKCNPAGELELKWFDSDALERYAATIDGGIFNPWDTGDVADGGSFNPWNTGTVIDSGTFNDYDNIHYIWGLNSQTMSVDDVVITGLVASLKDDNGNIVKSDLVGTSGYVLELDENPFITSSNVNTILTWLGTELIGLRFRKLNITHRGDPSIEAGDVAIVIDRKQYLYPILVTRVSFSADGLQTVVCGAATPSRNSVTKYSSSTKSYVEARKLLNKEVSAIDQAMESLEQAIATSAGLYCTKQTDSTGTIYYLHDQQQLASSKIVWRMSDKVISVTTDYKGSNPSATVWTTGITADGSIVAQRISALGIAFDWAIGVGLTLGGSGNTSGRLRVLNASGTEIAVIDNNGINVSNGKFVVDTNGNVTAMSLAAYGSFICYENYTIS